MKHKPSRTLTISLVILISVLSIGMVITAQGQSLGNEILPAIYLPFMVRTDAPTLAGRVLDDQGVPIAGATISDQTGRATLSDANGDYQFVQMPPGEYEIAAAKDGVIFYPSSLEVSLPPSNTSVDFTGTTDCVAVVVNGSFESDDAWTFPEESTIPASYTTQEAHLGVRALLTGLTSLADNADGYSFASQTIAIPAGATEATLYMWVKSQYEPAVASGDQRIASTDGSTSSESDDFHFVMLKDLEGNLLASLPLPDGLSNWQIAQFDLLAYAGQTLNLQVGTYNDGFGGVEALFVDEVSLNACASQLAALPSAPSVAQPMEGEETTDVCVNKFLNSDFEYTGNWVIADTARPAIYSTAQAAFGSRSLRTGIVNPAANKQGYSEAYQMVRIPGNATSARLGVFIYPISPGAGTASAELSPPTEQIRSVDETLSRDIQYIEVQDEAGNHLDYLLYETRDDQAWMWYDVAMLKYAGQRVRVVFGTYNDGHDAVTAMYVDLAMVVVCTPGVPPPPPATQELLHNNYFENNEAWVTPLTEFTAGYTTRRFVSPVRSMRVGIPYNYYDRYAYSTVYQEVEIPAGGSAELTFNIWTKSNEGVEISSPAGDAGGLSTDIQYALVLDENGYWIDTLMWRLTNYETWELITRDMSAYCGETVSILFGVYNNGNDKVSAMWVDDVELWWTP
jgi:hypothetical protein